MATPIRSTLLDSLARPGPGASLRSRWRRREPSGGRGQRSGCLRPLSGRETNTSGSRGNLIGAGESVPTRSRWPRHPPAVSQPAGPRRSSCPWGLSISSQVPRRQENAASTARTASGRLTEHPSRRSFQERALMTVWGSPQRHRWVGDVPGQPRLLRRLISTAMAIAHSSDQATMLRAA